MTKTHYEGIASRLKLAIFVSLFAGGFMLTGCQSTKTVATTKQKSSNQTKKVEKAPWYQRTKTFTKHHDYFQAIGTAISLDSSNAVTKARHTSIAILQSQLQEILEGLRTEMVNNGVKVAKQPLYILQTRTCLNDLYDQLDPNRVAVKANGRTYKAYVEMRMSRSQLWDNWKKSLSAARSHYMDTTNGNPVIRAWLHPEVTDSTSTDSSSGR